MAISPNSDPSAGRGLDRTLAFLLLRLFLGLRTFFAGLEKFELGGTYSFQNYGQNMSRLAQGITGSSFLPLWATRGFALALGYLLLGLGASLLLGVKTRIALALTGLLYVGLAFGLMAVQENEGVAWLAIQVGLVAGALVLVRHDRLAVWPDRRD